MSVFRKLVIAMSLSCFSTSALANPYWGDFRSDGCIADDMRSYSAVLWGIPFGQSWELACSRTSATINTPGAILTYSHPTLCLKSSVVDVTALAAVIVGVPGIVWPPAGAAGVILGAASLFMSNQGLGALNMWGVFYVQDPQNC